MIAKSLIAAAAVAASLTALAPVEQAQAKITVDINVGGYGPGFYPGYGYPGYGYPGYYPVVDPYYSGKSCWQVKQKLYSLNFKKIHAFDCEGKIYKYKAKKFGNPVVITTTRFGKILNVNYI